MLAKRMGGGKPLIGDKFFFLTKNTGVCGERVKAFRI